MHVISVIIWACDVTTDLPDFAQRCHYYTMAHEVVLRPIGRTLYAMPPHVLDAYTVQWLAHWRHVRPRWQKSGS
jgi:adenosylmethionine-8-amino-7-oxononanoate aminotransferase